MHQTTSKFTERRLASNGARHGVTTEAKQQATSGEIRLAALFTSGESASDMNDRRLSHSGTPAQIGSHRVCRMLCNRPEGGSHG
jgi:hypothetical protein